MDNAKPDSAVPSRLTRGLLASLLLLASHSASAAMVLDNSIVTFEPNEPNRQDITIENRGDEVMYVQVTPYQVTNPGSANPERLEVVNPKQAGLLVSPNKLAIPAKGRKMIRLINLNESRSDEGVYRVEVKPVSGKITGETSGVKVLVGYEVLVLALPQSLNAGLTSERSGNELVIKNTGNAHVMLSDGEQCPPQATNGEGCTPLADRRVYANSEYRYLLTPGWSAKFQTATGKQHSVQTFE